ncbi:hypothetical protein [Streptomyces sp. NRRL B-1347]|uniref:hypothetical protein n=1 Tax=Streptomyces sp. NRRL B-1347 TaxID=1476877 RepID=UPI0004C95160|nr:hypothetical protein [Streptomyces sp. NRRL B-1347]
MPDATEALRLFAVPAADDLTEQQRSGAVCVWCEYELHPREGIDLGGPSPWRPHGCAPCCEDQSRALTTYLNWYDHGIGCLRCPLGPCEQASALATSHLSAQARAGRPELSCVNCRATIAPDAPVRPHLWQGLNGPVFSYLHARTCPAPDTR